MKHRLERASELIKRELGAILSREMSFGESIVTIHQVSLTPDLRKAHIHVSAVGGKVDPETIISELMAQRKHLQTEMSRRVILKYTPLLTFHYDESVERGSRVLAIMEEIKQPEKTPDE